MEKITESAAFFNVADTLECGQIFRYERRGDKFLVHSGDKSCLAYNEGGRAVVLAEEGDGDYFYRFFDLAADYGACYRAAKAEGGVLADAAERGRGIRILRQDAEETLFSFIVSQNNHIPRIRKILFRLCEDAGAATNLRAARTARFLRRRRLRSGNFPITRRRGSATAADT